MPSFTARQVADALESIAPLDSGIQNDELGFLTGDPAGEVRGVACMWNVHAASLKAAIARGWNLLIVHESPFIGEQKSQWYDGSPTGILPNRIRRELIEEHGLIIYRSHSNWDALQADGVPDQAVAALGISGLRVVGQQKFFKVHELPWPMTARILARQAQKGLGMPWPPRIFGDADKHIERFAFLIGGFGGNQFHMPQAAYELGAQAIIVGEMLESIAISTSVELGMPVIETLHSLSEIPAIRRQTQMLQKRFPQIPVEYIPSGALNA